MKEDALFILAEQTFARNITGLTPELLAGYPPEWFELGYNQDRASVTVRDLLNYHAYDTAWVPEEFAGKTVAEVGDTYNGDLLGDEPVESYAAYSRAAVEAIETGYDPARTVHFSYGDYPAREAITHITAFRVFRAYDFARLTGADRALPPALVEAFYAQLEPNIEQWREMGVFKAAAVVASDADPQARLLALVGRDPEWH